MRIWKLYCFEAAHVLPRHEGKCSRLHGHSFRLRVDVGGPVDGKSQFVLDYAKLNACVEPLIQRWDHQFLNSFIRYPSSENIATHAAWYLQTKTPLALAPWLRVSVSETEKTWAIWDSMEADSVQRSLDPSHDSEWKAPPSGFSIERASDPETRKAMVNSLLERVAELLADTPV